MRRRSPTRPSIVSLSVVCAAGAAAPIVVAGGVEPLATVRVASGLAFSNFVTYAPGDFTRLFIIEKPGRIQILNLKTGELNEDPFLDINSLVGAGNTTNDERGLLGLAFHPDYQNNGFFYVNYTNNSFDTTVARYEVTGDPDVADAGSASTIMIIDQPQVNHNGGWIGFSPNDGYLYIATGDGGNFCDVGSGHTSGTGNAQDITSNLLGKILRIDIDGNPPFEIPPDNPFVGNTGDDEIWAYGLRNPWRNSFDRETGDLYIGDVGQDAREEVDYQPFDSAGGENYGWRCMEGNGCSSESGCSTSGCTCGDAALTDPIHDYRHIPPPPPTGFVCAVTGGYVYRGCDIPTLDGHYFFADFCGAAIWSFRVVNDQLTDFTDHTSELSRSQGGITVNQIASFGEDARGEIYIVDQGSGGSGQIFKIIPEAGSPSQADFNCDGMVGIKDLLDLLAAWGPCDGCIEDIDGDGVVSILDLLILLAEWG